MQSGVQSPSVRPALAIQSLSRLQRLLEPQALEGVKGQLKFRGWTLSPCLHDSRYMELPFSLSSPLIVQQTDSP